MSNDSATIACSFSVAGRYHSYTSDRPRRIRLAASESLMSTPLRVLIIEDSEDDALLLLRELRRGGYDVTYQRVDNARTMYAALDSGAWDLVMSDHSMPGFSGMQALELLRSRNVELPFIFVSGTLGEEMAVNALKSGAQDYLLKGNLKRLRSAVDRTLEEAEGRRERRRLETQINQLQRFEAIGRLAGGIAHDFNNVLGSILGWAELGQADLPEGHRARQRLTKIRVQAERAAALTRQLLAFARRQVLEPQNLDVNALVSESVSLMGKVIGEHVHIELQLDERLEPAWADASQIEQIIMNLCINARDAMPEGGRLTIETRMAEVRPGVEEFRAYFQPGRYVQLTIADTGIGMDRATLEHIFEPFFTTKEVGKGTGLGLATVYGIVNQHKGIIDVESHTGRGTRFHVYLPVGTGVMAAREKKPVNEASCGTETILIAEDNDDLREAVREMIEALGYRVLLAHDGEEALQLFTQNSTTVDLVMLDVVMPKMHGPAAYAQMIAIKPGVPAIFTTGYATEADSLACTSQGRVGVLQKPYGTILLGQKIRGLLDEAR
jgi:two-component system, cell cycle sensor histidine kinase and response regulator CckA